MWPPSSRTVFLCTIAYVLALGALLQKVLIPLTPWHGGHGLIAGKDWVFFHRLAVEISEAIGSVGWKAWELRPAGQLPAGIAAALYALTGIESPMLLLPINALLYAIAAWALFRIGIVLFASEQIAAIAILPVYFFPSSAMVWGQIHKDVWMLSGCLLGLLAIVSMQATSAITEDIICATMRSVALFVTGIFLVWLVRPHAVPLVYTALMAATVWSILAVLLARDARHPKSVRILCLLSLILAGSFYCLQADTRPGKTSQWTDTARAIHRDILKNKSKTPRTSTSGKARHYSSKAPVARHTWWPESIRNKVKQLSDKRKNFIISYSATGSAIDHEISWSTPDEAVAYLPRASLLALCAPFPTMWFRKGASNISRVTRSVSALEMSLLYTGYVGIALALVLRTIRWRILLSLLFFAYIYSVIVIYLLPNLGTVYRVRYPAMIVLGACGLGALASLWQSLQHHARGTA